MKTERHFGLRIDDELLKSFAMFASMTDVRQTDMIRQYVAKYERENGKVVLETDNKTEL